MVRFSIEGMCCAEETALLERSVGNLLGGTDALRFDLMAGTMSIDVPDESVDVDAVKDAVQRVGMRAEHLEEDGVRHSERPSLLENPHFPTTVMSGILVGLGILFSSLSVLPEWYLSYVAFGAAMLVGLFRVFRRAWFAIRAVQPDMNLLMTMAVIGAVGIDEWLEGGVIAFLFSLSLLLEAWSVGRARNAVERLLDRAPEVARRVAVDDSVEEIDPADVQVGDRILVRPGDRVPVDGRVLSGATTLNESAVTGESVPAEKAFAAPVFAGTICENGAFEFVATRPARESTFANIVRLVEEAGSHRSASERWVERFARIYTPVVLGVALLTWAIPALFTGGGTEWFYRALVVLVIGCPCALVISTPVSIVAGLASAARNGVLIKGGEFLELPATISQVAFDKTGTLTVGHPSVSSVVPLNGHNEAELIQRAAALESHSSHPLARAVLSHAHRIGVDPVRPDDFHAVEGKGAEANVLGRRYRIGSKSYMAEWEQSDASVESRAHEMGELGETIVAVGSDSHVCGLIGLTDRTREEANGVIDELHELDVSTAMLTGDSRAAAERIAGALDIDTVYPELLPHMKVELVESLSSGDEIVAMIGDGVNDAPAMARSSIGIAMGGVGSDVALETADVVLMSDNLRRLPWLIRHSRRTRSIVRTNIALAIGIKVLVFAATFAGFASLWAAIVADIGATLLVTSNALRLLRIRP